MRVRMAGATDIGRRRKNNQDAIFFDEPQGIGIVADGIGGRKGGAIASSMLVDGLRKSFVECESIRTEEISAFLASSIDRINSEIIQTGLDDPQYEGMGTTLNCLLFVADTMFLAHVGDSRTYLFYKDQFWQLTIDHNIENFVKRGWLPQASLQTSGSQALVKSVGLANRCEPDILEYKLKGGEFILTCSDGLSSMVSDRRICQLIKANARNFARLPQILIEEANRNGGKDNITVLLSTVSKD